jgi:hypothetical protein
MRALALLTGVSVGHLVVLVTGWPLPFTTDTGARMVVASLVLSLVAQWEVRRDFARITMLLGEVRALLR